MNETTERLEPIKFQPNIPVTVELQYNQPKECNSKFGKSFLYGTNVVDNKQSFFATEALSYKIDTLGAGEGDKITIVKKMADGKTWFEVEMAHNPAVSGGGTPTTDSSGDSDFKTKIKAIHDTCQNNPDLLDKIWKLFMAETTTTDDDLPF